MTLIQSEGAIFDTSISGIVDPTQCAIDSAFTVRSAVDMAIAFAKSVLRTGAWRAADVEVPDFSGDFL
jgi:hypothetical protein